MSLWARRNILALHKRIIQNTVDDVHSIVDLGQVRLFVPALARSAQTAEWINAMGGELEIYANPDDDLREGDLLVWDGITYEITELTDYPAARDLRVCRLVAKEVIS